MPMVCDVDWGALATFSAGLMAVGGAVWVGRKQVAVAARQAEILDRQAKLAELTLRHELFDRRWKVFEATRNFIAGVINDDGVPSDAVLRAFFVAQIEAQYLFPNGVYQALREISDRALENSAVKTTMQALYQKEGHYGNDNVEKFHATMQWLNDRLHHLSDIFGADLNMAQLTD
jgi:hypothetical protein